MGAILPVHRPLFPVLYVMYVGEILVRCTVCMSSL